MTGYGKCTVRDDLIEVTVEAKSLNSKALRLRISAPKFMNPLTVDIDRTVKELIRRGDVELTFSYKFSPGMTVPLSVRYEEAEKYISAVRSIEGLTGKEISVSLRDLLSLPEVFQREELEVDPFKETVLKALRCALLDLVKSREEEGKRIKEYLEERLTVVEGILADLEGKLGDIKEKIRNRLRERVLELLSGEGLPEDFERRLELEVAFLAERQDVSEEVSRLKMHLERFRSLLDSEEPVGKTLDFLCQEMHREINTLGNKLKEIDVTDPVVAIKSEIAKMKEQVQNVE